MSFRIRSLTIHHVTTIDSLLDNLSVFLVNETRDDHV